MICKKRAAFWPLFLLSQNVSGFSSPWNITYALDHNEGLKLAEFSENA